ncbi:predicted protein [Pyrenophora tritici-repentis Pt-1C-BFP]|uniref:Uncharacterized protein n=1 Tax=Pyrenophora tritici-repentis (strain Pt-1C-BFP) TaxID=426418 RepID=B2W7D3_PYRTR|nr:uncharacterized protein PTRG_05721 [Pyrenophora tritici-repentis Pt-1C-BFP]EDU48641.1 predicted protein [Pyrenophora tritici-repentis Pt-1C-BFP]
MVSCALIACAHPAGAERQLVSGINLWEDLEDMPWALGTATAFLRLPLHLTRRYNGRSFFILATGKAAARY